MKPLSKLKRSIFLALLVFIFAVTLPVLLFYSTGYRLDGEYKLVQTGGLFIGIGESGASVYVDDKFLKKTSRFDQNTFVQNLLPGVHSIRVEKEDHHTWKKELDVLPKKVTESYPFLISKEPKVVLIEEGGRLFEEIRIAFATSTADTSLLEASPATEDIFGDSFVKQLGNMIIWQDGNALYARWAKGLDNIPLYFCNLEGLCQERLSVFASQIALRHFDFYPGNNRVVLVATGTGVFAVEIDNRSNKNFIPVYDERGALFRVHKGELYVKDRGSFYHVAL
ncbi:MAG: hypothetical protein WDZ90_02195 [Candidatus Paceibacterota bacterium]